MSEKSLSVVYFLRSGDFIKIGSTSDLKTRVCSIKYDRGSDVVLIGALFGGINIERAFQKEFVAFNSSGDWFHYDSIMEKSIVMICKKRGLLGEDCFSMTSKEKNSYQAILADESVFVSECIAVLKLRLSFEKSKNHISSAQAMSNISIETGVSMATIWGLKYRKPSFVSAGVYFAITKGWASPSLVASVADALGEVD